MENLIPKKIILEEEFLPPELIEIRNHVLLNRGEDISIPLHIYEERVLFSEFYPDEDLISWSTIGNYYYDNKTIFKINQQYLKQLFLRGWIEVNIFKRNNIYTDIPEWVNQKYFDNFFILNENINFSKEVFYNFIYNFLLIKPKKRKKKIKLFKTTKINQELNWYVFVSPELRYYYYGNVTTIKNNLKNNNEIGDLVTITFSKKNESMSAAMANFESWQNFLHALNNPSQYWKNKGVFKKSLEFHGLDKF